LPQPVPEEVAAVGDLLAGNMLVVGNTQAEANMPEASAMPEVNKKVVSKTQQRNDRPASATNFLPITIITRTIIRVTGQAKVREKIRPKGTKASLIKNKNQPPTDAKTFVTARNNSTTNAKTAATERRIVEIVAKTNGMKPTTAANAISKKTFVINAKTAATEPKTKPTAARIFATNMRISGNKPATGETAAATSRPMAEITGPNHPCPPNIPVRILAARPRPSNGV